MITSKRLFSAPYFRVPRDHSADIATIPAVANLLAAFFGRKSDKIESYTNEGVTIARTAEYSLTKCKVYVLGMNYAMGEPICGGMTFNIIMQLHGLGSMLGMNPGDYILGDCLDLLGITDEEWKHEMRVQSKGKSDGGAIVRRVREAA